MNVLDYFSKKRILDLFKSINGVMIRYNLNSYIHEEAHDDHKKIEVKFIKEEQSKK